MLDLFIACSKTRNEAAVAGMVPYKAPCVMWRSHVPVGAHPHLDPGIAQEPPSRFPSVCPPMRCLTSAGLNYVLMPHAMHDLASPSPAQVAGADADWTESKMRFKNLVPVMICQFWSGFVHLDLDRAINCVVLLFGRGKPVLTSKCRKVPIHQSNKDIV